LSGPNEEFVPGLIASRPDDFRLRLPSAYQTELCDCSAERRDAEETAAAIVDPLGSIDFGHGNTPCKIFVT
jgi:hypothetical protein